MLIEALLVGFCGFAAALVASWGVYPRLWSESSPDLDPDYYIRRPIGIGPRSVLAVLGALLLGVLTAATIGANIGGPVIIGASLVLIGLVFFRLLRSLETIEL